MADPPDLAAIRARLAAATPGPWNDVDGEVRSVRGVAGFDSDGDPRFQPDLRADVVSERWQADAAFIASARTDVPALCDALDAARATIAAQAAEVERLRRDLATTAAAVDDAMTAELHAADARDVAERIAADALRYGLEECERLRETIVVAWGRIGGVLNECEPAERWHPADETLETWATDLRAAVEALRAGMSGADALRWCAAVAERDALRDEVARLRAVVEGRGPKGDDP